MGRTRRNLWATTLLGAALFFGCAHPPRPSYSFDTDPGGWELAEHTGSGAVQSERYRHAVHGERLEVFEVRRPAPAPTSTGFAGLAENARVVPPMGSATGTPRAMGDDEIGGVTGYWVEQHGREGDDMATAAVFVIPRGQRHFVARMSSREDEYGQLRGWLRDILVRNLRFPAATR